MRYANLITEDCVNGEGICVSLFMQGCHFHCLGCHNPETWDFNGGKEVSIDDLIAAIVTAISRNKIQRNFSILGGEPLAPENIHNTAIIVQAVRLIYPKIQICVWTGYEPEELPNNDDMITIKLHINKLITGRFKIEERDVSLPLRGSRNQQIIDF